MPFRSRRPARHGVDAGIVDDRIHPADGIDLIRDRPGLDRTAEVADHDTSRARREIRERCGALLRAGMENDPVPLPDQGLRRRAAEPIRAAGDEDESHANPLNPLKP